MTVIPAEQRQIRPCSVCAFFVYISNTGEGRCNLAKDEKAGLDTLRWEIEDLSGLLHWPCIYNLTTEEVEESVDSWVKSLVNESLRFRTSAHTRRNITANRKNKNKRY